MLFNHLVPVPGILLPSCLTNIHHLSVRFFPNRINLTKQSHSLTSSRQCPECYLQPSLPSYSEENSNHFPSTVIVPIAVFLSFSIAWFWIPVFLSHITGNPSKGGTRYHLISLYLVHLMKTMQVLSLECRHENRSAVHGAYLGFLYISSEGVNQWKY